MAQGMQVFGPDGRIYVDMTSNISQHQGSFITNGVNGSGAMVPLPAGKSRFYFPVPLVDTQQDGRGKLPGVTVNGNTLDWRYQHSTWFGQFSANSIIYYGYY